MMIGKYHGAIGTAAVLFLILAGLLFIAQVFLVKIKNRKRGYSDLNEFSSKVICKECGASYGRYIWHSNQKNRKIVYRCNHKYSNDTICKSKAIEPDKIKKFFVDEFNKINKSEHFRNIEIAIDTLCDTTAEEEKLLKLIKKRDDIIEKDNKFMEYYNKIKDKLGSADLGIITMKIVMESEYGTEWDSAYIKCMKENNGNWKSHTTMNVKWTKGDGLIHKFNITEEWFGLKYLYGWILTNEEYNEILSEVKTRCVESYKELISTKYPKTLGDERKKIWHRYSMYIGGASFRNELDSFCKEYEKTIEVNQDAIDKRNANKEEVYNKLEEYDKE